MEQSLGNTVAPDLQLSYEANAIVAAINGVWFKRLRSEERADHDLQT